jgi:hypothetical protein
VPPRKKSTPATPRLTADDVAALRARVSAGEKPRVLVRTASAAVPAGTRGNVIRVGNASDKEFIVVRLGRDEVPFAPNELALTSRSREAIARAPAKATKQPTKKTAKATKAAKPARERTTAKSTRTRPSASKASAARLTPAKAAAATKATAPPIPASSPAPAAPARKRTTRKSTRGSRRGANPLTVTLRFTDGGWTVEAQRGARRLARASALRPGAVKAFADLVDEPAVREALTETVDSSRAVVEERAAKLRAELQAAEESLREYEPRRR